MLSANKRHNWSAMLLLMNLAPTAGFTPATSSDLKLALVAWNVDATAANAAYGALHTWDVSLLTDFSDLLQNLANFDDDLSQWDTSRVTNMKYVRARRRVPFVC